MAIKKRVPLNSPFIRIDKKNPVLKGLYKGHFEKSCLDVDLQTGEVRMDEAGNELRKQVRVLKFETLDGMPVQIFETGGLKANRELIEMVGPKGIEIEWMGKTELGDGLKNVNEYSIYALDETPVVGLTSAKAAKPVSAEAQRA